MMMVYRHDNRPWLIGYSGGKDSTLLVSLVFRAVSRIPENERNKKVYVITSDTMVENIYLTKSFGKALEVFEQIRWLMCPEALSNYLQKNNC